MARMRTRQQLSGLVDLATELRGQSAGKWQKRGRNLRFWAGESLKTLVARDKARLEVDWTRLHDWLLRWEIEERRLGGDALEAREDAWSQSDVDQLCTDLEAELKTERDTKPLRPSDGRP